ncbi:MAG: hypothetical protein WC943_06495 [Elusimicrobiota bacterium]|jgi:uncharacterized protein YcfJ
MTMKTIVLLLSAWTLCGCATYGGWKPTVDPRGAKAETLERDYDECRELALQASGGTAKKTAQGTAIGAVAGTAVGAMLGALGGDAGHGAAVGAALGGTGGAAGAGLSAEDRYKRVYANCLTGRGHRVLD